MRPNSEPINTSTCVLLVRVDGGVRIGSGHVMRCLALAQAWQERGGQALFAMGVSVPALEDRLQAEGMEVVHVGLDEKSLGSPEDTRRLLALANERRPAWVVLDGYHFGPKYQSTIKEAGFKLLVVDDMAHHKHYYADIVLNQNLHAEDLRYSCEPYTRLLLGTKFVLLRREFWRWKGWKREIPRVARKVLVTLGGTDPDNVTLKVVQALQQVDLGGMEAVVIVGGANPHLEELRRAVQGSRIPVRLKSNVSNMAELMAWADVAISAGGSTCWELAFMGVPSILLILAENQRLIAEQIDHAGAAVNLGWHADLSFAEIVEALTRLLLEERLRAGMAKRAQELVDGNGVFATFKELSSHQPSVCGTI